MKAFIVPARGGLDRLTLTDLPDPGAPGAGEIRVAIHATSLNYHDLLVANGAIPTEDGRIPMADGAGVVEAVGEGVTAFRVGDHVVSCFFPQWQDGLPHDEAGSFARTPGDGAHGFAAEYVVRPADHFTLAPTGWRHEESATLTTSGLTAWRALVVEGQLKAGDTVLALGTGGVSITALQIAKSMGARVIITSSSDEKLARARALGADEVINYRTEPEWGRVAFQLAGGHGVEQVIEVGGPNTMAQSIQAVRIGGQIAQIGVLTGVEGTIPTAALMGKQARIQGLIVGNRRQQQQYVSAMNQTGLRPVIDKVFPFEALPEAFRYQESGEHFGKICVAW
ncbi:NAD(P)-dependent alcohol dehydrogenase [Nissabacter sp. SGAir0207]|uniref:zinc-dependent alcohol dehydrogenase family protein n=1 Tax=Nissabacter sp. SGAir0207 TaxID=2126321 RepID=UPI0010CD613D|nr:NAD(P)-dependent alcohol dehydrogenase [Nissabacter sp. SGAir0207]QCR35660.1 NAD(P)-dependent alcohol dehydrogenase [Nissabacter sp. SGAir0207]